MRIHRKGYRWFDIKPQELDILNLTSNQRDKDYQEYLDYKDYIEIVYGPTWSFDLPDKHLWETKGTDPLETIQNYMKHQEIKK